MTDETVLARRWGWSVVRLADGSLRLGSPYAGVYADLSRPSDVAHMLDDFGGRHVSRAGADVVVMLASLVGDCHD